ncbi:hypothetical protein LOB72_01985 [Lactobacillus delbrueckii subsp. lactis]|uniref:hypothetical protein n=1 Tax=Lactobacillus delbrueckii TaxID=1584 RepID=UPI001E46FA09|nr:hypothetical protein [Lactobacillus delbrueckii]MCD5447538.1 hypothetical protein [Lactobacillus delbrueckii subsp. lactis]
MTINFSPGRWVSSMLCRASPVFLPPSLSLVRSFKVKLDLPSSLRPFCQYSLALLGCVSIGHLVVAA